MHRARSGRNLEPGRRDDVTRLGQGREFPPFEGKD